MYTYYGNSLEEIAGYIDSPCGTITALNAKSAVTVKFYTVKASISVEIDYVKRYKQNPISTM